MEKSIIYGPLQEVTFYNYRFLNVIQLILHQLMSSRGTMSVMRLSCVCNDVCSCVYKNVCNGVVMMSIMMSMAMSIMVS